MHVHLDTKHIHALPVKHLIAAKQVDLGTRAPGHLGIRAPEHLNAWTLGPLNPHVKEAFRTVQIGRAHHEEKRRLPRKTSQKKASTPLCTFYRNRPKLTPSASQRRVAFFVDLV